MATQIINVGQHGFESDESESGHIRTSRTDSDLVHQPFVASSYNTSVTGFGNTIASVSQQYAGEGGFLNPECLLITVPRSVGFGTTPACAVVKFQFMGRKLSISAERYYQSNPSPIQGWVDGQFFSVPNSLEDYSTGFTGSSNGGTLKNNFIPIPVQLTDDGPHQCDLYFPSYTVSSNGVTHDNTGISSSSSVKWLLYGYCVERRFGLPEQNSGYLTNQISLTTSMQNILSGVTFGNFVRKIEIFNISSSTDYLTVERSSTNIINSLGIASNSVYSLDFGCDVALTPGANATSNAIRMSCANNNLIAFVYRRPR